MNAWLDRARYPFEAHYADLPAGRMHYVDEGSGPPVVLVHGNPAWSFLYRDLIGHLRARHRCVAPDHLGFGLSGKPAGWSYRPQAHAANLADLLDALGLESVTLVVHDWGGPIGLSWALDHPERVRRVVLLNTWMWPVDRDPYYAVGSGLLGSAPGRWLVRRFNLFAAVGMKLLYARPERLTPAVHRHYRAPLATPSDRTGCAALVREILAASGWLDALWRRRAALNALPKLIVWGMDDRAFRPRELARWRDAFPDARVVELEGVGHFVPEEAPARLREAVDRFLRSE